MVVLLFPLLHFNGEVLWLHEQLAANNCDA